MNFPDEDAAREGRQDFEWSRDHGAFDGAIAWRPIFALLAAIALALLLFGCTADSAFKCGANGTVDMDPNPAVPPPHCG